MPRYNGKTQSFMGCPTFFSLLSNTVNRCANNELPKLVV